MDPPERRRQLAGKNIIFYIFLVIGASILSLTFQTKYFLVPLARENKNLQEKLIKIGEAESIGNRSFVEPTFSKEQVDVAPNISEPLKPLDQCTPEQLKTIKMQLPPEECLKYKSAPWWQECSFSYASRCPDANWLEDFYTNIHSETSSVLLKSSFVGVFIGCNKGFDAFNALRMGSGSRRFEKSNWRDTIHENVWSSSKLHQSVCGQDVEPQFRLPERSSPNSSHTDAILHCIEPMPQTYMLLKRTAVQLNITDNFKVVHAAFSSKDGSIPFPKGARMGQENKGITNCLGENDANCMDVKMYSLDTYVDENLPPNTTINYLSVDVEGFDSEVLLGGYRTALSRTHYLEFEYNWMGPWGRQRLSTLITELENLFGFACYWPGKDGNIWRITECFLDYYDIHFWSNIACVNRRIDEARYIAEKMENMFLNTLEKGDDVIQNKKMRTYKSHAHAQDKH